MNAGQQSAGQSKLASCCKRSSLRRGSSCWAVLLALLALLQPSGAAGAEPDSVIDRFEIAVLTFGPGDHPFAKFGHTALLVEDRVSHTQRVYNYGTFRFDSPWLLPAFFLGRYRYWLSVDGLLPTLLRYRAQNRSVTAQYLNLEPAAERELVEFLQWNVLPENKYYVFDYYRDNCSTRIRDLVDQASAGALKSASARPAEFTWRQHTLRLTADAPLIYFGLHVVLGPLTDRAISLWEEQFLPAKLEEALREARLRDAAGALVPLIEHERVLLRAQRTALRREPPRWAASFAALGVAVGGVFAALGWAARFKTWARWLLGSSLSVWGLLTGFLGTAFLLLWIATDHEVAHRNHNLLLFPPFALWLLGSSIGVIRNRARDKRRAYRLCVAASACTMLALGLDWLPGIAQENGQLIALMLPIWLGASVALYWTRAEKAQDLGRETRHA